MFIEVACPPVGPVAPFNPDGPVGPVGPTAKGVITAFQTAPLQTQDLPFAV